MKNLIYLMGMLAISVVVFLTTGGLTKRYCSHRLKNEYSYRPRHYRRERYNPLRDKLPPPLEVHTCTNYTRRR
ncbi:MAG: hypothetical protein J1E06_05875 [Acutalibacter sp.]|nr:hypothetical protein [Acutalibacter sp.]